MPMLVHGFRIRVHVVPKYLPISISNDHQHLSSFFGVRPDVGLSVLRLAIFNFPNLERMGKRIQCVQREALSFVTPFFSNVSEAFSCYLDITAGCALDGVEPDLTRPPKSQIDTLFAQPLVPPRF